MAKHQEREKRIYQIRQVVYENPWIRTREIAERCHMAKSPHLIGLLKEMCERGMLGYSEQVMPNGAAVRIWCDTRLLEQLPLFPDQA